MRSSLPNRRARFQGRTWCPEGDLNPHRPFGPADFKSAASADFAIRALITAIHCWDQQYRTAALLGAAQSGSTKPKLVNSGWQLRASNL